MASYSVGLYAAVSIIGIIAVIFLFIYTDRQIRRNALHDLTTPLEPFVSLSQLRTNEKAAWRDRMTDIVCFMLFQGFITTDNVKNTIQSVFSKETGRKSLQDLFSYLLDGDGARYYTDKLWVDFVDWESSFPYDKKPMTYMELKQFVRQHRMFSGDEWNQTMAKTTTETMATLNQFYNVVLQLERMIAQVTPSNPLVIEAVSKRSRYMICALSKSTTFEAFNLALVGLGIQGRYTVYTQNEWMYKRLLELYQMYKEPALSERFENWLFLLYQWEHILSTSGPSSLNTMTETINRLPSQCMDLMVTPPSGATGAAGGTAGATGATGAAGNTTGAAGSTGAGALGTYYPIPSPPFRQIIIPTLTVPSVQVGLPKDTVAFTPMDTKEDRKIFFIVTLVFIGIIFILWDLMFYMWFSSGATAAPAAVAAGEEVTEMAEVAPPVATGPEIKGAYREQS